MAERARLAAQRKDGATFPVEISLSPVPTATEHYVLAVIRDAAQARQRDDLADLARGVAAGQPHLARELLDRVVQHLFQVGLSLRAAADLPGETARERLGEAIDRLDEVIHEIRDYAFTAVEPGGGPDRDRPGAS
jgi:signal transduction histidine kinase